MSAKEMRWLVVVLMLAIVSGSSGAAEKDATVAADLKMWYDKPAANWEREALPIGNGCLGGMIFGDVDKEHIQFNEDSLWTGDANPSGNYKTMGGYQAFGDLYIDLPSHKDATRYRRELDIGRAVHTITYVGGGA